MIDIISILVAGIFSCIILDILGYLLKLMGIPEPSWGIVGRWTYYMFKNGTFLNPKINEKLESYSKSPLTEDVIKQIFYIQDLIAEIKK